MQLIYISNRPNVLAETLAYVRAFMPWVDEVFVFCPRAQIDAMRAIDPALKVRDEISLLDRDVQFGPSDDHQRRNYILRAGLSAFEELAGTFIMSDDDARPLRNIADDYFVAGDGRHQPYFFHHLDRWEALLGRRRTSFDIGMLNTRNALDEAGLGSLAFAAHMPQVVDRALLQMSVTFFADSLERFGSLTEWDTYFNFAICQAPERFLPPLPFTVLGWPDGPHWPWLVRPTSYDFENFSPDNYAAGAVFHGLATAFDPRRQAADLAVKVQRYESLIDKGMRRKLRRTRRRRFFAPAYWRRKWPTLRARPAGEDASGRTTDLAPSPSFEVAGLFRFPTGLGNAASMLCGTMAANGPAGKVRELDLSSFFDPGRPPAALPLPDPRVTTLILAVNPPQARDYLSALPRRAIAGKRIIGYWWWEFPSFPEGWEPMVDIFDEVWVSSPFIYANWRQRLGARLRLMPLDLRLAGAAGASPHAAPPVRMLSMFNLGSTTSRKNPIAAVEVFRMLRRDFGAQVEMTIKVGGVSWHPLRYEELLAGIGKIDKGLTVLVADLSKERIHDLLRRHDFYVSLHRAEGLGLPLVQAMLAEKVAVATGWSGNTAFMTDENSVLVDYSMVRMEEGNGNTRRLVECAEPSVADAASRIAALIDDPDRRLKLGQAARRGVEDLGKAASEAMSAFFRDGRLAP